MAEETIRQRRQRLHSPGSLQIIESKDGEYVIYFLHGEELSHYHAVEYYDETKQEWIEGEFVYPNEETPIPIIASCDLEDLPAIGLKLRFDWDIIQMDYS